MDRVAVGEYGFLNNPLQGWPNDDLMLKADTRATLSAKHRGLVEQADWPRLRTLFEQKDARANLFRKLVRWQGGIAIIAATLGLMTGALTTSFGDPSSANLIWIGVTASALTLFGGLLGAEHLMFGYFKRKWILNRYWTERLRQLFFQTLLVNIDAFCQGINDKEKAEEWRVLRETRLNAFADYMARPDEDIIRELGEDLGDECAWFEALDTAQPPYVSDDRYLGEILVFLGRQRLDIQLDYIGKKMLAGVNSPKTGASILKKVTGLLTVFILATALAIGVLAIWDTEDFADVRMRVIAAEAAACALLAGLRVFDEGLRLSTESELYSWYGARLIRLKKRFHEASPAEKLRVLKEVEQASYEEFRRFVLAHHNANFLI